MIALLLAALFWAKPEQLERECGYVFMVMSRFSFLSHNFANLLLCRCTLLY